MRSLEGVSLQTLTKVEDALTLTLTNPNPNSP